ncbi:MAG TPA: PEP/pyruvate-binding domain-containing protein [Acidimicrobiales bacterium]|nr:PEP/pyruvate-binding domain-containing protein [Acidimicrobiales bacterium]
MTRRRFWRRDRENVTVVSLAEARATSVFGSKAVGLGDATRQGIPVPPGFALSGPIVEAVASGDERAMKQVAGVVDQLEPPLAVRSSAVDEDGAEASFAGQHLTILNVETADDVNSALRDIWWSANSDSAITYRQRVGLVTRPSVGVVVQTLVNPDVAGVMFTTNPITGANECVIEASWGLGEAVVSGRVIPDHFRLDRTGEVLERKAGRKRIAIRSVTSHGSVEEEVAPELVTKLCLDDDHLKELSQLALRCEQVYGAARDIEWAFAGGKLYLLQCRAVTAAASETSPPNIDAPIDILSQVPLLSDLDGQEMAQVARLFKERHFAEGETIVREGTGGSAFYLISSGTATVSIAGEQVNTLHPGDYFGEMALIDEAPRSATVTATSDMVCLGITLWEFRPLVQGNGRIGWKLMQLLAKKLRAAEQALSLGSSAT